MDNTILLIILLVTCWTLNPFLKRQMVGKLAANEYMIFNHSLCTILIVLYVAYLLINRQYDINTVRKLSNKDIFIAFIGAFITVVSSVVLISLLQNNEASYIIPHVQPCIIVLTLMIGYFFFEENISRNKLIGTGLIAIGLGFMNKK
tara:strand:+ start:1679 stop:2119 length:441 start_codon:yes stop_codon:yes gene_type:complete